jgi:SprT-like family
LNNPLPLFLSPDRPRQLALLPVPAFEPAEGSPAPLAETFERVFRRLAIRRPAPTFEVEFRAFVGLRSTIHLRDGHACVRISDVLEKAPPLVLEALAEILLAQLFRRRASLEARECYLAYIFQPEVRRRIDGARRQRGFKRLLPPQGLCYDLEKIFSDLNRRFFKDGLRQVRLGWTPRRSRTILGHYDSAHRTISISRWLDSEQAPPFLVEYLVYHEMLHARFPVRRQGHRRVIHSPEFRAAEKQFPKYEQAIRHLKRVCGSLD